MIKSWRMITACPISCSIAHLEKNKKIAFVIFNFLRVISQAIWKLIGRTYDEPLVDFLVLVSGLHLLVSRRVFSQDVSLFAFRLSVLVIIWFTHPLHVPFSYRHATVNNRWENTYAHVPPAYLMQIMHSN